MAGGWGHQAAAGTRRARRSSAPRCPPAGRRLLSAQRPGIATISSIAVSWPRSRAHLSRFRRRRPAAAIGCAARSVDGHVSRALAAAPEPGRQHAAVRQRHQRGAVRRGAVGGAHWVHQLWPPTRRRRRRRPGRRGSHRELCRSSTAGRGRARESVRGRTRPRRIGAAGTYSLRDRRHATCWRIIGSSVLLSAHPSSARYQ